MSDLDGLVPWLHEQLDAREKLARAAAEAVEGTKWSPLEGSGVAARGPRGVTVALGPDGYMAAAVEDHIADHDPARVLLAVAAKRELIDQHRPDSDDRPECVTCGPPYPCTTLRLLATEYADRPGEEW